jgi:hypothetical protein
LIDKQFIPLVILFAFPIVSFALSRTAGWHYLAELYACKQKFIGEKFMLCSVQVGGVSYKNCMTMGENEHSIYLSPLFVFKLWHKSISIPREHISAYKKESFFGDSIVLKIKGRQDITISQELAKDLKLDINKNR